MHGTSAKAPILGKSSLTTKSIEFTSQVSEKLEVVDSSDPVSIFVQNIGRHATSLPLTDVKSASRNKMHEENESV